MAFDVGAISVRITADISDLSRQFSRGLREIDRSVKGFSDVGKELTKAITIPIAALGIATTLAAVDFEQAMAGVAKTVDEPASEIARLGREFIALSDTIPASAVALATVGQAAGQLGIETKNILGFTKVMTDLGVSTNLSAEDAAVALARLANITQLPQDQFDRLGSTVVALGNNLATTEREIVEMGLRIAGAGKVVGLTQAQILAFAGALSSVGVEAQAGGTSISRAFVKIASAVRAGGDDLAGFARVAGVSSAEFARAFEEDAAGATVSFIEGLGRINDAGGDVFKTLDDLSLGEIRVRDALLRASGAGDLFRRSLELGNVAWRENTALTKEAALFYGTTKNQLAILKNQVVNTAIAFGQQLLPAVHASIGVLSGAIGVIRSAVNVFAELPAGVRNSVVAFFGLVAAIGPLLVGLAAMAKAFAVVKLAATLLTGALGLSGLAGLLVPGGAIIAGLSILIGLFITAKSKAREAALGMNALTASLRQFDVGSATTEIGKLEQQIRSLETEQQRLLDLAKRYGEESKLGKIFRQEASDVELSAGVLKLELGDVRKNLEELSAVPPINIDIGVDGIDELKNATKRVSNFRVDTVAAFEIVREKHRDLVRQIRDMEIDLRFASSKEAANRLGQELDFARAKAQAMADELARAPEELRRLIDLTSRFSLPKIEVVGPSVKGAQGGVIGLDPISLEPVKAFSDVLVRTVPRIHALGTRTEETTGWLGAFVDGLTASDEEFKRSRASLSGFGRIAADVGRGLRTAFEAVFGFASDMGKKLINLFNPLTIAGTVLDQAFRDATGTLNEQFKASVERIAGVIGDALQPVLEAMIPVFDAITPIIRELAPLLSAVAQIFAALFKAVAPILQAVVPLLRGMFPIFKFVAIIATYLGQAFALAARIVLTVIGFFAKAVGTVIEAIGKAIDKLPFISGKSIINAGRDIKNFGSEAFKSAALMNDAFHELGEAREEIKKIELEDPAEEAGKSIDEMGDAASDAAVALWELSQSARNARIREESTQPPETVEPSKAEQTTITVDSVVSVPGGITIFTSGDGPETYDAFRAELLRRTRAGSPEAQALADLFPA